MVLFRNTEKFYDIVIQGYSTQYSLQIQSILSILHELMFEDYPLVFNIILQSDNAPAYSSSENIRCIYQLNKKDKIHPTISQWVNSEAQKGKTKLDCHFSYVGQQFCRFVESGSNMVTEKDVFKALTHHGGIKNSATILLDLSQVLKLRADVPKFQVSTATSHIHDVRWDMERKSIEIRKFSFHTPCEILHESQKRSLVSHIVTNLSVFLVTRFDNVSPELRKRSENSINRKPTSRSTDAMLFQAFSMMYEPNSTSQIPNPSNQSDLTSSRVDQQQGWGLKKRRKNDIPKQVLRMLKDRYNKGK